MAQPASTAFAPFQVTICGLDELAGQRAAGVTHVLSLLDPGWPEPEVFLSFDPHARLELRFHDIIDPQRGAILPERRDIERLLAFGRGLGETPRAHLLVHCHAGISRSTASAAVIVAQARSDRPAAEALDSIARLRPRAWPNLRIIELGDELLGRGGTLVEAARTHYRRVIERDPSYADIIIAGGRGREVAAASGR